VNGVIMTYVVQVSNALRVNEVTDTLTGKHPGPKWQGIVVRRLENLGASTFLTSLTNCKDQALLLSSCQLACWGQGGFRAILGRANPVGG